MNYRHIYHAGNFADVFKHCLLTLNIELLIQKAKPLFFLDTHAGLGLYDLTQTAAQKNREFAAGILPILAASQPPAAIKNYLKMIANLNSVPATLTNAKIINNDKLKFYPGSPFIAAKLLRPADRLVFSELHPETYRQLKKNFHLDARISLRQLDAYLALKALLPPKERRGLILIDPAYENLDEFAKIGAALTLAFARFATGVYLIWYPIKDANQSKKFYQMIKKRVERPLLIAELNIYPDDSAMLLNGCGMIIINPPWGLESQLLELLPWLWRILSPFQQGKYTLFSA